ncbi:MAG: pentapeptide repeat-containing protein [Desulfobulbaceae bacterium]|nr:pentapeptide repeat-containing protein [Desulfobulbaceae bacterium]
MKTTHAVALLLLVALFLPLYGCAPSNAKKLVRQNSGHQLTAEQILPLVDGNTLSLAGFDTNVYLFLDKSGRAFGIDIHKNRDLGQWDVSEDGEFCFRMKNWWMGDMLCYSVYQVSDSYKLANKSGIIQFTASLFLGDYKSSFYAVKDKKKSYRRSIRSQKDASARATEEPADTVNTAEVTPESALPEKNITEANTYQISQSDKNLRSTVKWMARDCPGCNLSNTNLMKADLVNAQLAGANLNGANLRMANMRRANLQSANLEYAILTHCNMPGANLRNANLRNADLKGANLIRADLTGADLEGADLEGALLEGVVGLEVTEDEPDQP